MKANPLLTGYLAYIAHERRLSANTLESYGRDIGALLDCAGSQPLDRLQVHDVRRFAAKLHGGGLDARSIARMLSAWRGFYRYLARDHGYKDNPVLGIRAPRAAKRLPQALSPDEMHRLLEVDPDSALASRDKAMFELFYSSGLRLSELTGLAPSDVNHADGTVRVTGKGSKTRVIPVGAQALKALDEWLQTRAAIPRHEPAALFVSRTGKRLSPRSVQQRLKTLALKQGLTTDVHPHVLRHSFASHVLQSSGDLRAVQEMLGHASISTTQVYTHLDFQHLAKVYDAAHPRAKRKKNSV
ncbi:MAG TPA: tyrosine recombinase XerC [Burkholderiales bacterium]|nr:tyrosine recombinase XerC [Burkholderiales bacterium]